MPVAINKISVNYDEVKYVPVQINDSDILYAAKEHEKATGEKINFNDNGELAYEGFHMDISTSVTLEVADNVNVSEMDGAVVINKDFNSILQRDYHRRSILTITVEDGIVKKILDQ